MEAAWVSHRGNTSEGIPACQPGRSGCVRDASVLISESELAIRGFPQLDHFVRSQAAYRGRSRIPIEIRIAILPPPPPPLERDRYAEASIADPPCGASDLRGLNGVAIGY